MSDYKLIKCASACNKLKGKMPYDWDLNIYRGCEHGCIYCYALYSHDYLEGGGFFEDIYIKHNIVELLEKQFRSPSWKHDVVNIGSVCDSYQPAEAKYKLMPEILKIFIKYKNPCIISSKSGLILRDYDLIDELSRLTYVNIAQTITCADDLLRQKLEPLGSCSAARFEVLSGFAKTNASTGLHLMPMIPYLTDTPENISSLFECARESNVSYIIADMLNLRGKTRQFFFNFIMNEFPNLYHPLHQLFKSGSIDREYRSKAYKSVNALRNKYGLSGNFLAPMHQWLEKNKEIQLSFFDQEDF